MRYIKGNNIFIVGFIYFMYIPCSFAQVLFSKSDMQNLYKVGTIYSASVGSTSSTLSIGNKTDSNQYFDFSKINFTQKGITYIIPIYQAPFADSFLMAQFAVKDSLFGTPSKNPTLYQYESITDSGVYEYGYYSDEQSGNIIYQRPPSLLYNIPLLYGTETITTDSPDTENGIIIIDTAYNLVDAYGQVKIEDSVYNCLRLKSITHLIAKIPGSNTLLSNDTSIHYEYLSNSFQLYLYIARQDSNKTDIMPTGISYYKIIQKPSAVLNASEYNQKYQLLISPNPFNSSTHIVVSAAVDARVSVADMLGRTVAVLHSGGAGEYIWQPTPGVPSGTYFVVVKTKAGVVSKSVMLLR